MLIFFYADTSLKEVLGSLHWKHTSTSEAILRNFRSVYLVHLSFNVAD